MNEAGAGDLRVLVVDDSLDLQRSLTTLLAQVVHVQIVGYAQDSQEALAMVESCHPDLVVLDVALRGNHRGIDVLRRLVAEHPRIKVIMLSNFTWNAMRRGLLDAGALAYFDKGSEFVQARDFIAALAAARAVGQRLGDGTP